MAIWSNDKARWGLAAALTVLALSQFGAALYYWIGGGVSWYFLGFIKIRLHQWEKPWLEGIFCFAVAVIVRPGGFLPASLFRAFFDPWRFRGPSLVRPWAVLGAASGFGVGMYISRCWHYLFPTFLYTLPFITAWAVALAGLAAGAAMAVEKLFPTLGDRRRQGLLQGGAELILLALVYWPLSSWEGFAVHPFSPLALGFGLALVHIWFIGLLQRYRVLAGRRKKIVLAGVAVGLISAMAVSQLRYRARMHGPAPRDRVIFITLDTTRADHLSAYGYPRPTSPNFDAVAASGARFAFAICPLATTDPSHVSMFTGAYPRTHGSLGIGYPITGKVNSLPQYFADHGFATAAVLSRRLFSPSAQLKLNGFNDEFPLFGSAKQTSAPTAYRRAVNWLDRHRNENIFLWVHFYDPHQAYRPHPGFPVRFTEADNECVPDKMKKNHQWTPAEVQECVDLYDGEIAYMDFWVGRLLNYVETLEPKSERPPMVVLVSDHGEVMGEHLHQPLHYAFGHAPLINSQLAWISMTISWPGRIRPAVVGGTAEVVDLAPTLVDYIFDRSDFACQGRSMRPAMEGREPPDQIGIMQQGVVTPELSRFHSEPVFAVFRNSEVLREYANGSTGYTDLVADPLEALDLSAAYPENTAELAARLEQWKKEIPETKPETPKLSPHERTALRALGYIQ